MSYARRIDAARKFGGTKSLFNDSSAQIRGAHAQFPASYPKYSMDNTVQGTLETGFRLFLPATQLLRANPQDSDILKPLVNGQYIDLIVTSVQEQFSERVEVKQLVNGAFATYYYGIAPPQFVFSGVVLNDFQDDWRNQLLRTYTRYLRGTNLSKVGRQIVASYADIVVQGECTNLSTGLTGQGETHGSFTLSMIVHKLSVRKSPLVSDFNTKDNKPQVQPDSTVLSSKKTVKAGVRSSSTKDVFRQSKMTPEEIRKRNQVLENQKKNLKAAEVNAKTRLTAATQAYNSYQIDNPWNPFDSEGLSKLSAVRTAQTDLTTIRRSISEVTRKQKEMRDGTAQRDPNQRKRKTQTTTPSRAIQLSATSTPPVNRRISQGAGTT